MSVVVGLDVGTSGVRALAVEPTGNVIADASAEYPILTPRPGWSEQHPEQWWRAARAAIRKVTSAIGGQVVGLGLAGQMHGSVFLDARDRVIRPALLWNDQRTDRQCQQITETLGRDNLVAITGNPALTGFQAPKVLWLRDEEPAHFKQVAHVLLPKDYIRLQLSHEYATDASDASGTLLLDLRRRVWSQEILNALDIPSHWLPPVFESPTTAGTLDPEVATELGLPPGIPIAAGAGDNAAAAVGIGVVEDGLISSSIGSSGVLFANTANFEPDPSGRLHAFCHAVPGGYHLLGVTLSAGDHGRAHAPPRSPRKGSILRTHSTPRPCTSHARADGRRGFQPGRQSRHHARPRRFDQADAGHRRRRPQPALAPDPGRCFWNARLSDRRRRRSCLRRGSSSRSKRWRVFKREGSLFGGATSSRRH